MLRILLMILIPLQIFALSLDEAKQNGLVGENIDGYISAIKPSSEVNSLVNRINKARKEQYERISKKNNQPLEIIEKIVAKQIYHKLNSGEYYKKDGRWIKK